MKNRYYAGTDLKVTPLTMVIGSFISAWTFMLIIGAAHSGDARIPTFSFWVSFALVWCVWMIVPSQTHTQ